MVSFNYTSLNLIYIYPKWNDQYMLKSPLHGISGPERSRADMEQRNNG